MSDHKIHRFSTGRTEFSGQPEASEPEVWLRLERYATEVRRSSPGRGKPVLLLHGASANSGTFKVGNPGLAPWLYGKGFDPWMLDWRGSSLVVGARENELSLRDHPDIYNFNRAASEDLPVAIGKMRLLGVEGPISLLGHCMGSAVIAEAVALGHVDAANVDRIVLIALGLFYEAPVDSRLKSEERILEHLTQAIGSDCVLSLDPSIGEDGKLMHDWPEELKNLYNAWPEALRSHPEEPGAQRTDPVHAMCNRLSFMYGMPYHHKNLVKVIHDHSKPELPNQFGAIPLRMYLHAARNLRRGHATFFAEDTSSSRHNEFVSDEARARFHRLERVTLMTGALNRLWHRDSVDRMYEWLCRGPSRSLPRFHKHIVLNYAHQDLLWGECSPGEVYPEIAAGLEDRMTPSARSGIASTD